MPDGRDFGADGAAKPYTITKGKPDPHGDMVDKIYISTDEFVIYLVRLGQCPHLRYVMPVAHERAKALRASLTPIMGLLAFIDDMVCELRAKKSESSWEALRERTHDMQARAMQLAFEGQGLRAVEPLTTVRAELEARRDSRNRMDYVFANLVALIAALTVWLGFESLTFPPLLADLHALMTGPIEVARGEDMVVAVRAIDVLALGALGAFFSVSLGIRRLRINHAIKRFEMYYTGFVRVTIGVIAAAVVVMLINGGWILSSIEPSYMLWTLYLFGFLAGFSEQFVPNALNQVDAGTSTRAPTPRTPA